MAKLTVKQIQELAKSIIASNPGGIRYSAIVKQIMQQSAETPENTVYGSVWSLDKEFPGEVTKPSRAGSLRPRRKQKTTQVPSKARRK